MQRHNLPDIQELMWQKLSADVASLKSRVSVTNTARERAEVAGGFANLTLATLPTVNNTGGDVYFASDGCKPGEATGHGTGTSVFWDATTSQWLRVGDYQSPSGGTPLPVTSGGTGASTLTAHAMLIGNGTSAILGLAPGANRNVSISNGTDWTSRALVAADLPAGGGSPLTTKGDLYGFDTASDRVPVGADGSMLIANSAAALGLNWANNPTITGGSINGAPIGQSAAAAITGTAIEATSRFRATGNGIPSSGSGLESNFTGTVGQLFSYNRTVPAWLATTVDGLTLGLNTNSLGALSVGGLFTTYNNIATQGYGVPAIVSRVGLTAQGADIVDTNLANAGTAGEYVVYVYFFTTTADATAGTATCNIKWNDGTTARVGSPGPSINLTVTTSAGLNTIAIPVRLGSGNITYGVTHTGTYATARYALYISCHRVN